MPDTPPLIRVAADRPNRTYLRDLWHYRELLYTLSWRDFKVRYKQTVIGAAWALLRPLLTMLIFVFVFGRVAGLAQRSSLPYLLVVLAGVLPWQLLASTVSEGANSLFNNRQLLTKVYFPRMLLPLATVATALLDFCLGLFFLLLLGGILGVWPSLRLLWLPLWLVLALLPTLGLALWLGALTVRYRDFRHALPFMVQLGLFASPVGYPLSTVPPVWHTVYMLNPLVGVIEVFRWLTLGPDYGSFPTVAASISAALGLLLLALGSGYFWRVERSFADWI